MNSNGLRFFEVMNQRCKKKKKKGLGLIIIHRGYEPTSGERNVGGATSMVWARAASGAAPSKKQKKTKLEASIDVKQWGGETAKTSANFWFMCKQQFVRTADLTALLPLLRPAEIDGRIDESDNGVQGSPRIFHRNIKSIHIPGLCREFPFYRRWCLFKQRSRKRTRPIGSAGRGRQMMDTKEIPSPLTANKSRHFIIFHIY